MPGAACCTHDGNRGYGEEIRAWQLVTLKPGRTRNTGNTPK